MSLGARLKEYRSRKKLNQKTFSEAIGVTQSAFSAYETDINNPSLEILTKMAEAYSDLDLHWLITGFTISDTSNTYNVQFRLNEYQRTIAVYEKAIEMLYDKFKSEK